MNNLEKEQFDAISEPVIDDSVVAEYLRTNLNFFYEHESLLMTLSLNHQERGSVSLVQRQQELQRLKIAQLEEEITQLMSIARQNEALFVKVSALYRALVDCTSLEDVVTCIAGAATASFNLVTARLFTFAEYTNSDKLADQALMKLVRQRLENTEYYFGRMSQSDLSLLFPDHHVGSIALMRLGEGESLGVLVFGAAEEYYYSPSMDVLFLNELRKLITKVCMNVLQK